MEVSPGNTEANSPNIAPCWLVTLDGSPPGAARWGLENWAQPRQAEEPRPPLIWDLGAPRACDLTKDPQTRGFLDQTGLGPELLPPHPGHVWAAQVHKKVGSSRLCLWDPFHHQDGLDRVPLLSPLGETESTGPCLRPPGFSTPKN